MDRRRPSDSPRAAICAWRVFSIRRQRGSLKYETGLSSGDGAMTLALPDAAQCDATANAKRRRLRSPDRILISQCPVEAALG